MARSAQVVLSVLVITAAVAIGTLHPRAPSWSQQHLDKQVMTAAVLEPGAMLWSDVVPGSLLVDVRAEDKYLNRHAPGAMHLDFDQWDEGFDRLLLQWNPEQAIVVYCEGGGCQLSQEVAERLRLELGVDNIYHIVDGWDAIAPTLNAVTP